jgi:peptidyl-prolyl cis-trans isomerase D
MLDYMRKNKSSVIIKVIFGILALVMIGFGVQYAGVDGAPTEMVAEVNSRPIYRQELQRSVSRMVTSYRELYRDGFSSDMLQALKLKDQALDDLIRVSLLRQEAERLGLEVTNDEVRDAIALIPSFQDNGRFNRGLYERILQSNRLTPANFEEMQREDLMVRKLQDLLLSGVYVSDDEIRRQFEYDNEQVSLRFLRVRADALADQVEVGDQQVQEFYEQNRERFREPERVRAEVVTYGPAEFAGEVVVEESEIEAYYTANGAEFEGRSLEESRLEIELAVREKRASEAALSAARAAHEQARAGQALSDLAAATKGRLATVGPLARGDSVPGIGRAPELMRELFATEVGQIGTLVETGREAYVVQVVEKLPSRLPELDEIREEIVAETRRSQASKQAQERAGEILARLGEKADLEAIAAAEELPVEASEPFRRLDSLIPGLGAEPELRVDAFALTSARPVAPSVYDVDGDAVIAVLGERLPAAGGESFEAQKDSIRDQIDDRRKRLVMEEYLRELRERAQIRINPGALDRVYLS